MSTSQALACQVEVTAPTGPDILALIGIGDIAAMARLGGDIPIRSTMIALLIVDMTKACLFDPSSEQRIGA